MNTIGMSFIFMTYFVISRDNTSLSSLSRLRYSHYTYHYQYVYHYHYNYVYHYVEWWQCWLYSHHCSYHILSLLCNVNWRQYIDLHSSDADDVWESRILSNFVYIHHTNVRNVVNACRECKQCVFWENNKHALDT